MNNINCRIWGAMVGTGIGIILLTLGLPKLIVILVLGGAGYFVGRWMETEGKITEKLKEAFRVLTR